MSHYQVELVWNREFNFVPKGQLYPDLNQAIKYAKALENMGDGACVKKTRIIDTAGNVVWAYGRLKELEVKQDSYFQL